jgi:hypothetical protein
MVLSIFYPCLRQWDLQIELHVRSNTVIFPVLKLLVSFIVYLLVTKGPWYAWLNMCQVG